MEESNIDFILRVPDDRDIAFGPHLHVAQCIENIAFQPASGNEKAVSFGRKRHDVAANVQVSRSYKKLAEGEQKVVFGGRLGEYKYYDMDAVIASALDMCEENIDIGRIIN